MAQFYNITQYQPGGEWKSPYGMLDSFFLDIEGYDGATIMTNKKQGNTPKIGQVYGELIFKKKGKKGQDVFQFKQLEQPEDAVAPASSAPQPMQPASSGMPEWFAPFAIQIHQIHDAVVAKTETDKPATEEKIAGTNVSKSELEDIFGGSMDVVEIEE